MSADSILSVLGVLGMIGGAAIFLSTFTKRA